MYTVTGNLTKQSVIQKEAGLWNRKKVVGGGGVQSAQVPTAEEFNGSNLHSIVKKCYVPIVAKLTDLGKKVTNLFVQTI